MDRYSHQHEYGGTRKYPVYGNTIRLIPYSTYSEAWLSEAAFLKSNINDSHMALDEYVSQNAKSNQNREVSVRTQSKPTNQDPSLTIVLHYSKTLDSLLE